jgi:hypothetical protein
MPRQIRVRGIPRDEIDTELYTLAVYLMGKRRVEEKRRRAQEDREMRRRREDDHEG